MPKSSKPESTNTSPKIRHTTKKARLNPSIATKEFIDSPKSLETKDKDNKASPILEVAWTRAAVYRTTYQKNARNAYKLSRAVLIATVFSIAIAVIYNSLKPIGLSWVVQINSLLKYLVILSPISVSILVSMAPSLGANIPREFLKKNMGNIGNSLDVKNSNAQSDFSKIGLASGLIEREIYLFRAKCGDYKNNTERKPREQVLAEKMNLIHEQLIKTGAIQTGLESYFGPIPEYYYPNDPNSDPGFNDFTGDEYFRYRTEREMAWFFRGTNRRAGEIKRLKWMIYIFGGLGTFLAAIGLEIWLAVTGSVAGALTSWLEQRKIDSTIAMYNQTLSELWRIYTWWISLTDKEKKFSKNIEELVLETENALISEDEQKDFFGKKKQSRLIAD